MKLTDMLSAVENKRIQFATMRPLGSGYATLERRVVVTDPLELVQLTRTGNLKILDKLIELLQDPGRAWAAEVLLAAMTRHEEKIVDSFTAIPNQWWDSVGKTAHERWSKWLDETRDKLVWDSENNFFVERK